MARDKQWVVDMIAQIVPGSQRVQTAEMIVDRLMEEGVLHLGYGDADVDRVVSVFSDKFGTTKTTNADRFAARRLTQKYGAQAVVGILTLLAQNSGEQYVPIVGSVAQLETKWVQVLNFVRKMSAGTETID
jgi:hypothetical protein